MSKNPGQVRRHGFTLIEVIVVITIVSVMVALLLPSIGKTRSAAQVVGCSAIQRQLGVAMGAYLNDHRTILPYFMNSGNVSSNVLNNSFITGGALDGVGRLLKGQYLQGLAKLPTATPRIWPPKALSCPGRDLHGIWNSATSSYGDYAIGWATSSDDFVSGGFPGQQLKPSGNGASYWPPGTAWTAPPQPTFSPKLRQYAIEWYRTGTLFTSATAGKSVLITDTLNMTYDSPKGVPHANYSTKGVSTALLVDMSVSTIYEAFNFSNSTVWDNGYNNIRPWQWGGRNWWNWMESKVPVINRQTIY